jgi:hypothetical protein
VTTVKDYLDSALKAIERAGARHLRKVAMSYLRDAKHEIKAAARVAGIELEKEKGK